MFNVLSRQTTTIQSLCLVLPALLMFTGCGSEEPSTATDIKPVAGQIAGKVEGNVAGKGKKAPAKPQKPKPLSSYLKEVKAIPHPYKGDWQKLYTEKDFAYIEKKAKDLLAASKDSFEADKLTRFYDYLTTLSHCQATESDKDAAVLALGVLNEWCNSSPTSYVAFQMRGELFISYAWLFRGGQYAPKVDKSMWPLFHKNLELAKADLERAYQLNPKDPNSGAALITVAMGLSMPRHIMEAYYQMAVTACQDHKRAASAKTLFIMPRWHGDKESVLVYARDCLKHMNQKPSHAMTIIIAHDMLADHDKTYKSNPNHWQEIEKAYTNFIKQHPQSDATRLHYAYYAYKWKQYDIAVQQFELLKDRYSWSTPFDSLDQYNRIRHYCYAHATRKLQMANKLKESIVLNKSVLTIPDPDKGKHRYHELACVSLSNALGMTKQYEQSIMYANYVLAMKNAKPEYKKLVQSYIRMCKARM